MPKRGKEEVKILMQKAFQLLDSGLSTEATATQLNVSVRTVQRWNKERDERPLEVKAQDALAELVYNPLPTLPEQQPIEMSELALQDLENYHKSQKLFATGSKVMAAKLQQKIQIGLEMIQPEDITIRSLPALIKSYIELVNAGSDCWARAVGLDRIIEKVSTLENIETDE